MCTTYSRDGLIKLDPHFSGLNGHEYEFQGESNKVFALVSEPHVQVNARFVKAGFKIARKNSTVMGDICVRFCDSTVTFDSRDLTSLGIRTSGPSTPDLVVKRLSDVTAQVSAGFWTFTVELDTRKVLEDARFLNLNVNLENALNIGPMHGVLGVTAPTIEDEIRRARNITVPHPHCQAKNEGGCEVPGEWQEYEVKGNDLCGTEFKYSKFDHEKCAAIAANLKRGVAESITSHLPVMLA